MKNKAYVLLLLMFASYNMQAQTDDFNAFRSRMLNDFQDFRKGILDRYVEFLDAAWAEFETIGGSRRVTAPKPDTIPVYTPPKEPVEPVTPKVPVTTPIVPTIPKVPVTVPKVPTLPKAPVVTPKVPEKSTVPETTKEPKQIVPDSSKVPQTPKIPTIPSVESTPQIAYTLYGMKLSLPAPKIDATLKNITPKEVARFWKQINESETKACVDALQQYSEKYQLGDWCTFKAVEAYCDAWAKGNVSASRVMMQYLMLSMGYDVRMAIAGNEVYLMFPFEQQVYDNNYLNVNNAKYYLYPKNLPNGSSIYSCSVPTDVDCGRQINLIVNPAYRLPHNNHPFALSSGSLSAQGNVNKNVIALLQEYPSMDVYCYAASVTDEEVRRSVVEQLKGQLSGMSEAEAANALLHFVQKAFEYKTDGQQFGEGVEKSFFFDETLYFPYCDCEDRSIFYAYLVHEILGLNVLLVEYPGHESTAVALSVAPPKAKSLTYKGRTYYICDPTYMGADIGMCMPRYIDTTPTLAEWHK